VLFDSGMEHYRGSFQNRAMYVPLAASGLTIVAGLGGSRSGALRGTAYALAGLTGLLGLGFHAYNIAKRPSGVSWLNLFYAAPVGAPAALSLAGLLGGCAQRVRKLEERKAPAAESREWRGESRPSSHSASPAPSARLGSCISAARSRTRRCSCR
jgi:hypothetical protein